MARLSVNGIRKYKKPTTKSTLPPLLPTDLAILKQLNKEKAIRDQSHAINEPLEYTAPLRNFNPLSNPETIKNVTDVSELINAIIANQWTEYPTDEIGRIQLSNAITSSTHEFRTETAALVTVHQLYGLYPTKTTKVDKLLSEACAQNRIKLLPVNGYDASDIAICTSVFNEQLADNGMTNLAELCRESPMAKWFTKQQLEKANIDVSEAVKLGFLTQHPTSFDAKQICLPGQGKYLKLLRESRLFVVKTISQNNKKFKEMPESLLREKYTSSKKFWSQFRGLTLETVLYECIGSGYIDGFETPVGRGWKVMK